MSQKGSKRERRRKRAIERRKRMWHKGQNMPAKGRGPLSIRKAFMALMLRQAKAAK